MKRFAIVFITTLLSVFSYAQTENYPLVTENGKQYYLYTVQQKEGYYAVSKRFNVTQSDIIAANPEAADGLKLGQTLRIPVKQQSNTNCVEHVVKAKETLYSLSKQYGLTVDELIKSNPDAYPLKAGVVLCIPQKEKTATSAKSSKVTTTTPTPQTTTASQTQTTEISIASETAVAVETPSAKPLKTTQNKINIAILMPFVLDSVNRTTTLNRFVDFYRGCLLAADSLKSTGMQINISSFDIGKTASQLKQALSQPAVRDADLIIGPAYASQIQVASVYAKAHHIPMIIPFSNSVNGIEDNPYIIQLVSPQKELYQGVSSYCAKHWVGKRVTIVRPDTLGIRFDKKPFVDLLCPQLDSMQVVHSYINTNEIAFIDSLIGDSITENILIIPTSNKAQLVQACDHLARVKGSNVRLFGFPEWHNMDMSELYQMPLYSYCNYYTSFTQARVIQFFENYHQQYGQPELQTKPSYALMGYDVMMYFTKLWATCGNSFPHYLDEHPYRTLQMQFQFKKVGHGGYINQGVIYQYYNRQGIQVW